MCWVAESSPVIVTALNLYLGYEAAAQVAHEALESGSHLFGGDLARLCRPRRDQPGELDAALDVLAMTGERTPEASEGEA